MLIFTLLPAVLVARQMNVSAHTVLQQQAQAAHLTVLKYALQVPVPLDFTCLVEFAFTMCATVPTAIENLARSAQHTALRCAPHARVSTISQVVCASLTRSAAASNTRLSRPRARATVSARITPNAALDSTRAWHRQRRRTATARHTRRAWLGSTR